MTHDSLTMNLTDEPNVKNDRELQETATLKMVRLPTFHRIVTTKLNEKRLIMTTTHREVYE